LAAIAKFQPAEGLKGSTGCAKVSLDCGETLWKQRRPAEDRSVDFKTARGNGPEAEERLTR
jgi:hypothetical protein